MVFRKSHNTMYHPAIAVLYSVFAVVHGNNFPPVENPVPIPAPGVKAPLHLRQSGLYFSNFNPDFSRENQDSRQRWIPDPGFSYMPSAISQESFEQTPTLKEIGKLYETALPSIGPVATPPPDGLTDVNIRQDFPQLPPETVVLSPSSFWMRGKSNPYPVQQILSVPPIVARTIQIKELQQPFSVPTTADKNSKVISTRFINTPFPVQDIRVNDPNVYYSLRSLIDSLPKPKDTKWTQIDQTPPQPVEQLPKTPAIPVSAFPQFTNKNSDGDLPPNVPPPSFLTANIGSKRAELPFVPATSSKNIAGAVIGWIVTPDGQLSPVRGMVMPPKISQPPMLFNPAAPARVILASANGKSIAQVPARVSIDNTWVLRQSPSGPYFERLKSLLPVRPVVTGKRPVTEVVVEPETSRSPEMISPKLSPAPIIYRRGSDPQTVYNNMPIFGSYSLPHSPKSDVLVIGKGNTLAHLAPQKNIFPGPIPKVPTEPCLIPTNQQNPTVVPSANVIRPLPNIVPVSRKTLPNVAPLRADRPYPYYIWDPRNEPFMPVSPLQRNVFDSSSSMLPKSTSFYPNAITRNRFQHPLRYLPPSYNTPNIVDLQGRKPVGVEVIPPPLPEADSSAGSDGPQQSTETGSGSISTESSSETIPKLVSGEDVIEAEASIVDRLKTQASQVVPSFASPPIQSTADKDKNSNKKSPYYFDFKERDGSGIVQYRQESSDASGKVEGKYGQRDPSGIYREVDYTADKEGYHAVVKQIDPKPITQTTKTHVL